MITSSWEFLCHVKREWGLANLNISRTFALPFEKRVADKAESSWKDWRRNKNSKIFAKRFGSLKIMRTFATPFEKRVLARETTEVCF